MESADHGFCALMDEIVEEREWFSYAFGQVVGEVCVVGGGEIGVVFQTVFASGVAQRAFCRYVDVIRGEVLDYFF